MKRLLFFFPENPLKKDSGNKTRAQELLTYFKSRGFEIDFVGTKFKDFQESDVKLLEKDWVNKVHLIERKPAKNNLFKYFFTFKIPSLFYKRSKISNFVTYTFQKQFDAILEANSYDIILISYVYWAELVINNKRIKTAKTIIDTHDFATVQAQFQKNFRLGTFFQKEISRLDYFDQVWAISYDEYYVFSQFTKSKVFLIPFSIKNNTGIVSEKNNWDLIYVASGNIHNTTSANWFFEYVYPLLPKELKIVVIGKVSLKISDYDNVEKINFVDDLFSYYTQSKIAICPMLTGSGLKIKVVEAQSFGLPIVCNSRGVDGLANKSNNGCLIADDAEIFADYIIKLAHDSDFYKETRQLSISNFLTNHSIEKVNSKLDAAFRSLN